VITTGIGDAARAGAVLIAVLAAGMFAAHRAGEYAGLGGGYGMALAVVGLAATLAVPAAGMRFAVLGRAVALPDGASNAKRESVEALVAAGSAARAVGAVVVMSAGALTALALVVGLWEVSAAEIIGGGIGMVIGVAAGMVAIWYAAGWALHTTPDVAPARGATPPPSSVWVSIGALVIPVVAAVLVPVGLGHARAAALGGYLIGMLAAGPALVTVLVVASGAWENVRRLIEAGAYGGVGSRAHRAVVAADTVGESLQASVVTTVVALLVTTAAVALAFAGSF
jgi:K(+)-stimulated pyrophosphate-energized sodium pump